MLKVFSWIICASAMTGCSKRNDNNNKPNLSPLVSLSAEITNAAPFTFRFKADASDPDSDPLTFSWDFGEGTTKQGTKEETFNNYLPDKDYTVKVTVSDGKSKPTTATVQINTRTTTITIDPSKKFQTMDGFGGFGSMKEWWAGAPYTSDDFVNTLVNDLGLTILRDDVPTSLEVINDNSDPFVTDLSKFNLSTKVPGHDEVFNDHVEHLKKMKAVGLQKFIASIWSPPTWMKYNNTVGNGTQNQNSAPPYTTSPTANTNQLKTNMYDEFAEYCVAYVKLIKQETGLDVYALSIQNEPRFSQFYASCVYNGEAMRDVLKVVGKRFQKEGLNTKLFLPEDIGYLQGVEGMIKPSLDEADSRQYVDIVAVHGYDLDGVTAASPSAQTWQTMYGWGAMYNKPLWMTETSGFKNDFDGAMSLAKAMYTAIRFGNVSAWLHWALSTTTLDEYSLMSSAGEKSKRYYVSKNFYRYIRPGAVQEDASAPEESKIYPLFFQNSAQSTSTLVLINDNKDAAKPVKLAGTGLPSNFKMIITTNNDNAKDGGSVASSDVILLPANSVVTLYKE